MRETSPMTRTAIFRARAGQGQALAERWLHAATLVAEAPGRELWLGRRPRRHGHGARQRDVASREQRDAALGVPAVRQNAAAITDLTDRPAEIVDGGDVKVHADVRELRRLDAAPGSARELQAGPDALAILAFGAHVPGDGRIVADRPL